ncbi:MAG: hypothetical protein WB973_18455 [Thermoanaerobaculia bacterium]
MSAQPPKWKAHLLRTSIPLEHEAARILSQGGFNVSANYPYYRIENGADKEFSVDLRGVWMLESHDHPHSGCVFDVLVECKYRDRGTTWIFLPEAKSRSSQLHEAVQAVDAFSARFVHGRYSFKEEERIQICYSAVEAGVSDSGGSDTSKKDRAFEAQLRHGARQLQYALPALVALRARWVAFQEPDDNFPFFFLPLLLTNARLLVASHDLSVSVVEAAEKLEELGTETPWLIWSAELGPDFNSHCQRQLANLLPLAQTQNMRVIEERRKTAGLASWLQPSAIATRVAVDGAAASHIAEFTDLIVVNIASLPQLLQILRKAFEEMSKSLKDEPLWRG